MATDGTDGKRLTIIEQFTIFSSTGHVLWQLEHDCFAQPVNNLIDDVIIQEKADHTYETTLNSTEYVLKWCRDNLHQIIFVCIYKKILQTHIRYIGNLLERVKTAFIKLYSQQFAGRIKSFEFGPHFFDELEAAEDNSGFFGRAKKKKPKPWNQSRKNKNKNKKTKKKKPGESAGEMEAKTDDDQSEDDKPEPADQPDEAEPDAAVDQPVAEGKVVTEIDELKALQAKLKRAGRQKKPMGRRRKKPSVKKPKAPKEHTKKMAESTTNKVNAKTTGALDHSHSQRPAASSGSVVSYEDPSDIDAEPEDKKGSWSIPGLSSVTGLLKKFTGQSELTDKDLEHPLSELKDRLISKNVAAEIATDLCESVKRSLVGQKAGTFTRIKTMVANALHAALLRILTPKKSIDIVRSALGTRKLGRPFTIVFIGINGVGKSTSLSKVCYYLMSKKFKVMIAACDTFRSGAVEQLQEHGKRLNVPVFNKGYDKDPSAVAGHAIMHGKREGYDVVLIDTAGRMQNNTRLMKALAKLVENNNPDLVLFVGEALVGNDGIDQLTMFNQALIDHSSQQNPRGIDGIILTKFDTVDDKVGASLSMVYRTGQPIVFVGTGQKYTNLKLLNPTTIINSLFAK